MSSAPEYPLSQPGLFDPLVDCEQESATPTPSPAKPRPVDRALIPELNEPDIEAVKPQSPVAPKAQPARPGSHPTAGQADVGDGSVRSPRKSPPPRTRSSVADVLPRHPLADALPKRYLTVKQVAARYDVGIATVWRWIKELDDFPAPIRFSTGTTRWAEGDLVTFEAKRRAGK